MLTFQKRQEMRKNGERYLLVLLLTMMLNAIVSWSHEMNRVPSIMTLSGAGECKLKKDRLICHHVIKPTYRDACNCLIAEVTGKYPRPEEMSQHVIYFKDLSTTIRTLTISDDINLKLRSTEILDRASLKLYLHDNAALLASFNSGMLIFSSINIFLTNNAQLRSVNLKTRRLNLHLIQKSQTTGITALESCQVNTEDSASAVVNLTTETRVLQSLYNNSKIIYESIYYQ